jgi:hypothetical protein
MNVMLSLSKHLNRFVRNYYLTSAREMSRLRST